MGGGAFSPHLKKNTFSYQGERFFPLQQGNISKVMCLYVYMIYTNEFRYKLYIYNIWKPSYRLSICIIYKKIKFHIHCIIYTSYRQDS